ncbi:TAXI family TRAP transporter solute-binding subunit [Wenzhouxiangella marina]|uniref:C4-dicarboxylate ABC transporter substrate-binding protein n=1 Tax=Wenzhouxiangella marina TaxID=1579979 RepID=A0A0K0XXQ3_9GAMM|nr:TAXI family TRAP transporter solute-binding subunit [Wenzhouxiangella marina]AKS42479.1 C4-dicarboxylate ABC transporter substrate-binding protein [Wenzhouxiangella marina]MBB6085746.1 hypothetical protein [Wenzhouxiangella marina]
MERKRPSRFLGGLTAAILLLLTLWFGLVPAPEEQRSTYILATATTGGTFYPVGVAIATLSKQVLEPREGVSLAAISSAGSEENLRLLRSGEAGFAILQGLYGAWAWRGSGRLEAQAPFTELRSVTALWPNVEHFLIRAELAEQGSLSDLASTPGLRFSIGARYSGTEGSNRFLLEALGLDPDRDFELVYQGYGASADAFQNQRIDGMNTPAGVPVAAVTRALAAAGDQARLLSVSASERALIDARIPGLWRPYTIAAGTYPGQQEPVQTIAQVNFLAATASVPEEHVYQLLVMLYEHLDFLQAFHAATRAMTLPSATDGLPVPLHPGAVRFYREQGLELPDALIPSPREVDDGPLD